jgi:hypothetical protein
MDLGPRARLHPLWMAPARRPTLEREAPAAASRGELVSDHNVLPRGFRSGVDAGEPRVHAYGRLPTGSNREAHGR